MLAPGERVPDFTLPLAYADGRKSDVAFSSLLGRGPLVLNFFPLAFTSTCTEQMCELRDRARDLDALGGAEPLGFSCDSKHTNVAYARSLNLQHGIFSDPNRRVVERLWETQTTAGVERVPKRGWLLVGAEGVVLDRWITDDPDEWTGIAPIAAALAKR